MSLKDNTAIAIKFFGIYFIVSRLSAMTGFGVSLFGEGWVEITKILYRVGYFSQVIVGCYLIIRPIVWGQGLNKLRGPS
jgi:hypothetical protein